MRLSDLPAAQNRQIGRFGMNTPLIYEQGLKDGLKGRPSEHEYTMVDGSPYHREGYVEYRDGYLEGKRRQLGGVRRARHTRKSGAVRKDLRTINHRPGEVFIFQLLDGSKLYLETLPQAIRLRRLRLGFIPTKTLWEFRFPFYIRTVGKVWDLAREAMELVVHSIGDCRTAPQVQRRLETKTTSVLKEYVKANRQRAMTEGIEKLGGYAAEQYINDSQQLRDAMAVPQDVTDVVGEYGGVLDDLTADRSGSLLFPESALPRPREEIRQALEAALQVAKDGEFRAAFTMGLDRLQDFVPDDEIPSDPWEQVEEWFRRTKWDDRSAATQVLVTMLLTTLLTAKYGAPVGKRFDEYLAVHRK